MAVVEAVGLSVLVITVVLQIMQTITWLTLGVAVLKTNAERMEGELGHRGVGVVLEHVMIMSQYFTRIHRQMVEIGFSATYLE